MARVVASIYPPFFLFVKYVVYVDVMPCIACSNFEVFKPVFSFCSRVTSSDILTIRSACCSVSSSRCSSRLKTCEVR